MVRPIGAGLAPPAPTVHTIQEFVVRPIGAGWESPELARRPLRAPLYDPVCGYHTTALNHRMIAADHDTKDWKPPFLKELEVRQESTPALTLQDISMGPYRFHHSKTYTYHDRAIDTHTRHKLDAQVSLDHPHHQERVACAERWSPDARVQKRLGAEQLDANLTENRLCSTPDRQSYLFGNSPAVRSLGAKVQRDFDRQHLNEFRKTGMTHAYVQ